MYRVAIVLVFLGVFNKFSPNSGGYRGAILLTVIVSITKILLSFGIQIPGLSQLIIMLPFSANGFAWLVPAIIGFAEGLIVQVFLVEKTIKPTVGTTTVKDNKVK